jgi:hypothetical protein
MEVTKDPELQMLINNKDDGYKYRERRQVDWRENYTLYRDKVTVNRLTQRQSVNIPLMKQTIKTLLKDVDDMPVLYFENLQNDKEAEMMENEYWKWTVDQNSMEIQDLVDKKQVFLFGRSFDQWQIVDGKIKMTVIDPEDILVSRYMNPFELNSSRYLIHTHIFVPLSVLEMNKDYDQEQIKDLKKWFLTTQGLIKAKDNQESLMEKNKRLADMGLDDVDSPVLGETYVELTLHFVYREKEEAEGEELYLYVEAENHNILMKKRLEDVIGVTQDHYWQDHYPYNSWADDLERQDFWSDGVADIVRTPNKVMNSWFSQLVENRTLRNFGMHYYDTTASEVFQPQTFEAKAWGWYGVPGKPNEIIQKVDIPDLSESLDEMQYVTQMLEKATGATPTQQGMQTERQITLGEVQLALGEAKERIRGMSKYYTPAWKRRGEIFIKLLEAGADQIDAVKVYKKGRNTNNLFEREIAPKDWKAHEGYRVEVWSMEEKMNHDTEALQKLNAVKVNMPDNPKVDEVYKRKLVEFAGLDPDEVNDIMKYEEEKRNAMAQMIDPLTGLPLNPVQQQPQTGTQTPETFIQPPAQQQPLANQ